MKVAVPKERAPGEKRVAVSPRTIKQLVGSGCEVWVEAGAGAGSFLDDAELEKAGAKIAASVEELYRSAGLVLKVGTPDEAEVDLLPERSALIATIRPFQHLPIVKKLAERQVSTLAMDLVPRTTRAQFMDTLSSMATVAGYRAVILGASYLPKIFPMLNTAAGTVAPAKVFVLGAGVAGLQAIATARRLGATVEAFDVRPSVKEQVESLGARFVELVETKAAAEDKSGYAKEQTEEAKRQQEEAMKRHLARSDVVITTALIQGRRAPILIPKASVEVMRPGSVIVDLAAELGGNCELTEPGQVVVKHGVTIVGLLNLPSDHAADATQLYSRNVANLVREVTKDGQMVYDLSNEIVAGCLLTHEGQVRDPATRDALASQAS